MINSQYQGMQFDCGGCHNSNNTLHPESNTYHMECNYCTSTSKFNHFNDFLAHAHSQHGTNIAVSAMAIVANNKNYGTSSNSEACFSGNTSNATIPCTVLPVYELSTLSRQCLLEIIQLLNKCLCIWHRPTRMRTMRKDRVHAYQLLLRKLREYDPQAVFRDVRSIVRQLISKFFCQQISTPEELKIEEEQEDKLDASCSRTLINQLIFLASADVKDFRELDINKLCSFCPLGFYTFDSLWTHMVNAHVQKLKSNDNTERSSLKETVVKEAHHKENSKRRRSRSRSRSRARTWIMPDSDHSDSDQEPRFIRKHIRKIKKPVSLHEFIEEECFRHPLNLGKEMESLSELSDIDKDPATYYLSDYNDKFLEEFIDLYQTHECLWRKKSAKYKNDELCTAAYNELIEKYRQDRAAEDASLSTVKHLIRRIRDYYNRLNVPNANPYRSHIWLRLAFIDGKQRRRRRVASGAAGDSAYNCSQCTRCFKRAKFFNCHKLRAHPPTECTECSESFDNADDLHKHLLWFHRKATECPLCKAPDTEWQSAQHLSLHFYHHTCRRCGQIYYDACNYQRHRQKCRTKNRYKCWHCDAAFTSTVEIRRHSRSQHNDERPFKCASCELTFKFLSQLLKHRKLHQRTDKVLRGVVHDVQKCVSSLN